MLSKWYFTAEGNRKMNFLYQIILTIIISLARSLPQDQALIMARQISNVSHTREEAAMLITVSYYETGFRSRGRLIPFGMSGAPSLCRQSLETCALASLRSLQRAVRCSIRMEKVFGFYHTGRCVADPYSIRQAATYENMLRRLQ